MLEMSDAIAIVGVSVSAGVPLTVAVIKYAPFRKRNDDDGVDALRKGNGGPPCGKYSGVRADITNLEKTDSAIFDRIDRNHKEVMEKFDEMQKDVTELKVNTAVLKAGRR